MTQRLHEVLFRRYNERAENNPWVFWHLYFNQTGKKKTGPYRDRHKIMRKPCQKARVPYFR